MKILHYNKDSGQHTINIDTDPSLEKLQSWQEII